MLKKPAYLSRFLYICTAQFLLNYHSWFTYWPGGHSSASQERTDTVLIRDAFRDAFIFFSKPDKLFVTGIHLFLKPVFYNSGLF